MASGSGVLGMREGAGVFYRMQCRPATQRAVTQERAGMVTMVINSAALPFVPYEDLQPR